MSRFSCALLLGLAAGAHAAPAAPAAPAATACPADRLAVAERFTPADCPDCWAAADLPGAGGGWLFDWILPSPRGDEAELAAAATAEAHERAQRRHAAPADEATTVRREPLAPRRALRLAVQSGPAWHGYVALQLDLRGRPPVGSTGWLALVEELPAGSEGSAVARALVRAVAGPIPLQAGPAGAVRHELRALRWPANARAERLHARGWIEAPDGRMIVLASERCPQR